MSLDDKPTQKPLEESSEPSAFERFEEFTRAIISVPKAKIDALEAERVKREKRKADPGA